jgi:hypothetical protein
LQEFKEFEERSLQDVSENGDGGVVIPIREAAQIRREESRKLNG